MGYLGNNALPFDPIRSSGRPRDAQRFNGNGSTTTFTLNFSVFAPTDLEVFVENVQQEPLFSYDAIGNQLIFTEAPPSGTNNIYVVYKNVEAGIYNQIPDGSISYQKLANNIRVFTTDNYTGDNTTTAFTLTERPADANTLFVSIDGVVQRAPIHYTVSNTTITFASAPPSSSNVHVRHLGFRTTSTITALAANTTISQPILQNPTVTGVGTFAAGSNTAPAITTSGDTNTGIFFPAADTLAFAEGGVEVGRFNSSGEFVLGGTTNAYNSGKIVRYDDTDARVRSLILANGNAGSSARSSCIINAFGNSWAMEMGSIAANSNALNWTVDIFGTPTVRMALTTGGDFQFNSGYGSVATAYGCRAWVNFNGTGTVAIRASGNVSSITDGGVGIYTVNLTNALPDTNAAVSGLTQNTGSGKALVTALVFNSTSAIKIEVSPGLGGAALEDSGLVTIAVFR